MIAQGSPEWFAARLGKATASRIADVVAKTKTGYGASRANYMAELICERLTGQCAERFTNAAMQWGSDHEGEACDAYVWETDAELEECGFFDHPAIAMSGASPDRLIGTDGLLEVKCPNTATHLETLLSKGLIASKYVVQMQWQMACTGRAWCDFVSFDPRLPPHLRLEIRRVPRDPAMIADLEREVAAFLAELEAKLADLESLSQGRRVGNGASLAA